MYFFIVHSILSSYVIPFLNCFAFKLIAFSKQGVSLLYVLVMLLVNNFLYSVGESPYMFVVSSVGINTLGQVLTFVISAFIKFWNLLFMFLILMDFIMSSRSFLNASSSLICAGQFFDLKPKDSLSHSITLLLMKKCAFHRICLITLSILSKRFNWYDDFDGIGIFFKDWLKFIFSIFIHTKASALLKISGALCKLLQFCNLAFQ